MRRFSYLTTVCAGLIATPFSQQVIAETISFGTGVNQFTMDFVSIGNPGNAPDTTGNPNPAGSVGYAFEMGKFEVSEHMIDKANALGGLGITKATAAPNRPAGTFGPNRPATGVSWNEAARFVNWLNTSQGYQEAYKFAIQPSGGGYSANANIVLWVSSDPGFNAANPFRNSLAHYFLPSSDEWYKAAYYDAESGSYFDYPTGSNTAPTAVASGMALNTAVYSQASITGPADITAAGGLSPYGTMGQGGNAFEWQETESDLVNNSVSSARDLRGGHWINNASVLSALDRSSEVPTLKFVTIGFRVAALHSPTSSWTGGSSTSWAAGGNWSNGVPGATSGTTNTDIAVFNASAAAVNGNTTINIDLGRVICGVTFDTANAAAYTIGSAGANAGWTLNLSTGGAIQTTSSVAHSQIVNAPLILRPASSTTAGTYTFTSGATDNTNTLSIAGNISGGTTTAAITLTLNGSNTGNNTISGNISDGGATGNLAVIKSGGGTWVLSGNNTYSGGTTISTGTLVAPNATGSATGTGNVTLNGGSLASGITGNVSGAVLAGSGAHTIAPGGVGAIGTLNVGGVTTTGNTTLNFNLGSTLNSSGVYTGGDLLNVGNAGLTVGSGTHITFGNNPTTTGYYRLMGGTVSGSNLSNFSLPTPPSGQSYRLSATSDPGYVDLVVGSPVVHQADFCPVPPVKNAADQLAQWTGTCWQPVSPGSISGNVHVLVHGWAPGERNWVNSNGNDQARAWNDASYFAAFTDLAKKINGQTGDTVLAYSWIYQSATDTRSEPGKSEAKTISAGNTLANQLQAASGTNTVNLQLIGHSHGAKVVTIAAEDLLGIRPGTQQSTNDHVRQLTLLDSPEKSVPYIFQAANSLAGELAKLHIGKGPSNIFVDNYTSLFGTAYSGGVVNVALDPPNPSTIDNWATNHGYPIDWYAKSAAQTIPHTYQVGIDWSPFSTLNLGQSLTSNNWAQDWKIASNLYDSSKELNLVVGTSPPPPLLAGAGPVRVLTTLGTTNGITAIPGGFDVVKHSPQYWDSTFITISTDVAMQFDFQFIQPGAGDQLEVWIDNDLRFSVMGELVGTGQQVGYFDISDLLPGQHVMTFALEDYGTEPAEFTVTNLQVVSLPEPSTIVLGGIGLLALLGLQLRRRRRTTGPSSPTS